MIGKLALRDKLKMAGKLLAKCHSLFSFIDSEWCIKLSY